MTLEELSGQARKCVRCRLSRSRKNVAAGDGDERAKIMIIGEAPGREEDETGHVFVGGAGKFLDELFSLINLERKDLFITNVVKCRPPRNREPFADEIKTCDFWLERQVEIVDPRIIVLLGGVALKKYFPEANISSAHGRSRNFRNRKFFFSYHPAAALHDYKFREIIMKDIKKLEKIIFQMLGVPK